MIMPFSIEGFVKGVSRHCPFMGHVAPSPSYQDIFQSALQPQEMPTRIYTAKRLSNLDAQDVRLLFAAMEHF